MRKYGTKLFWFKLVRKLWLGIFIKNLAHLQKNPQIIIFLKEKIMAKVIIARCNHYGKRKVLFIANMFMASAIIANVFRQKYYGKCN